MKISPAEQEKEINSAFCRLRAMPLGCPIRVEKYIAKHWLLNDTHVMAGGNVFSILIKDIGLGVCEAELANNTQLCTKMKK